jgi:hypothetical protein
VDGRRCRAFIRAFIRRRGRTLDGRVPEVAEVSKDPIEQPGVISYQRALGEARKRRAIDLVRTGVGSDTLLRFV